MSWTRSEYKFLIPEGLSEELQRRLSERLGRDRNPGNNGQYPIVSQYYDSPDRECYMQKQRRLKSRRKIRVRFYGSDAASIPPAAFVEIKHKHFGRGVKRRLQMPVEAAVRFATGETEALGGLIADVDRAGRIVVREVLDLVERRGHVPAVQIRYDRIAFTSADETLRVTFDTHLLCRPPMRPPGPDDPDFENEIIDPAMVILEVKAMGPVPSWFRDCAGELGLMRVGFSKYCTAMEKYDPVLVGRVAPAAAAGKGVH